MYSHFNSGDWLKFIVCLTNVSFVLVNSIALEGDDCSMCSEARIQLKEVSGKVNCHKIRNKQEKKTKQFYWEEKLEELRKSKGNSICKLAADAPRPVLLQVQLSLFTLIECVNLLTVPTLKSPVIPVFWLVPNKSDYKELFALFESIIALYCITITCK